MGHLYAVVVVCVLVVWPVVLWVVVVWVVIVYVVNMSKDSLYGMSVCYCQRVMLKSLDSEKM